MGIGRSDWEKCPDIPPWPSFAGRKGPLAAGRRVWYLLARGRAPPAFAAPLVLTGRSSATAAPRSLCFLWRRGRAPRWTGGQKPRSASNPHHPLDEAGARWYCVGAMNRGPLLPVEIQAYCADRYLAGNVPPRELVEELKQKFGISVTTAQLRQWLTRSGLGARKKDLDAKTCKLVSSAKITSLAKAKAKKPAEQIEEWTEKVVVVADKALDMAVQSTKTRDLAAATSAASSAIRLFRAMQGLDSAGSGCPVFNFNFANESPVAVKIAQPAALEVQVSAGGGGAVSAGLD